MMIVVSVATGSFAQARERSAGPPETLASQRPVSGEEAIKSSFPIDFLGVFYDGDTTGDSVRFQHDGRWGPWVELKEDGVEVDGRWASALVPGSDAQAYQVRVPRGARSARSVAINTTDGPVETAAETSSACTDATTIVSRCEWGADESLMTWGAPEFHPAQKLTVHHTATDNGATNAVTIRFDSGFWSNDTITALNRLNVRYTMAVKCSSKAINDAITAIPNDEWTPIAYTNDGQAQVAECDYTTGTGTNRVTRRLIVRPTRLTDKPR